MTPIAVPGPRPPHPPEAADLRGAGGSRLLLDEFLPRYDHAVVHAQVFRAPPDECLAAALAMDIFRAPLIRALIDVRGLPQRLRDGLGGHGTEPGASRRTFRLLDMTRIGWIVLGETPGVEMVLGQVGRPWEPTASLPDTPLSPDQFVAFDQPGFAKIAVGVRAVPYGRSSSVLTMETRVALTDDASRRRFRRYWLVIGPFSHLVRRTALRLLASELAR